MTPHGDSADWVALARSLSPVARAALLFSLLFLAVLISLPVAANASGWQGCAASACAALLCFAAGVAVVLVTLFASSPEHVAYFVVLGMFFRMGIPLVACLAIYVRGGWLVEAGLVYYLLVYYPLALAAETWLDVVRLSPPDFSALASESSGEPQA